MSYRRHLMANTEEIVITEAMNAPLMALLYSEGLCKHSSYMTRKECDKVREIPKNFALNNTSLLSIEELKYFTNCIKISDSAFKGCTNLNIVSLPPNLDRISRNGFENCSSITDIILPNTVRHLGDTAGNVFKGCTNLKSINLDNVVDVLTWAFMNCTKLSNYGFTGNIQSCGAAYIWFEGANRKLFLPSLTSKTTGTWSSSWATIQVVDIGAKVTALEMGLRWITTPIVLRAPTPPTLTASSQVEHITKIFVPASSVTDYINSSWGTRYPNIIFAIGGAEWQTEFASAPNPADEYADVRLYAPSEYIDAYIEKYELAKNSVAQ